MPKQTNPALEIAKPLLEADILSNDIDDNMKPSQVYLMRDEYMAVKPYESFRAGLSPLKKENQDRFEPLAVDDEERSKRKAHAKEEDESGVGDCKASIGGGLPVG
jgi:hypothetical protein